MSTGRIANQMHTRAAQAMLQNARTRLGTVSSYNPALYAVKVKLQPEDVETGWLPIETLMAGAGWGVYFGPAIGDQALIAFPEGDIESGQCLGFVPNDVDRPPVVQSGEMHFVHKATWFLKFLADGIHSKGPWTHDGTLHTTQDITCDTTVTATTDVVGGGKSLKNHTHSDPQGGNTGAPN